jgi:hypothetical protein
MVDEPQVNKIYLSGTPSEIKSNLTNTYASYLLGKVEQAVAVASSKPLPSYVKGQCYIKLYFEGIVINTTSSHYVEKSMRLPYENPRTISLERLKALATNTKNKFWGFTFRTGVHTYTYNNPEQGFNVSWGYFESITDAKKLYEQMLDIVGLSPDWRQLSHSNIPEPGDRFSGIPEKVPQANILIKTDRERPVAKMKFRRAAFKFPHIRYELDFVTESGKVFDSLDVLSAYQ